MAWAMSGGTWHSWTQTWFTVLTTQTAANSTIREVLVTGFCKEKYQFHTRLEDGFPARFLVDIIERILKKEKGNGDFSLQPADRFHAHETEKEKKRCEEHIHWQSRAREGVRLPGSQGVPRRKHACSLSARTTIHR
ncbi:hypothetical protein HBH56_056050 [Parastagonospora nodorum]|uniref:DNA helicase n=1 Tax=Phaeosphaeria nodorum (strain SN15 / ATCC MYA-4574 / FGSC 10173) TaxID=321614 RepID=A0A7U2FBV4_PHANO|nr:hypothetical protein HBH56_056050 [Parastagonospora nodorum]QRD02445.1 hypothetical protein JI435_053980 [Parastagonospora nodorum SN15]KAH3935661.1 hypothetical protein HBH54_041860 [Parastagonospora nodorum]KAH3970073.1 hypothetical protein HBH51_121980 [Parastagonospora nodorum]KAH4053797.1 hypothetical protein HBH49_088640 [Parastagonospora nodorum]